MAMPGTYALTYFLHVLNLIGLGFAAFSSGCIAFLCIMYHVYQITASTVLGWTYTAEAQLFVGWTYTAEAQLFVSLFWDCDNKRITTSVSPTTPYDIPQRAGIVSLKAGCMHFFFRE